MLKYRRIIAGILAVNLLAGSILLDYTEVNANNVNTSLNMISAENSDEVSHADAESVSSSEKTDAENKADEKNTTPDANENDENTASSNSDAGLTNETQEEETTKQEPSSEIAAEDASWQASETETEAEAQEISDTISLGNLKFVNDNIATITSPQQLILLSHCAQNEIQNITININTTGEFKLSTKIETGTDLSEYLNTAAIASQDYTYLGLGSTDSPFSGTITGQKPAIRTNTTLFRGISSNATIENGLSVEWQGDKTKPMFAETYVLQSNGEIPIPITFTSGNGSLLGTVKKAPNVTDACLTIGNVVTYNKDKVQAVSPTSNDNIGLICNTLESGTIKLDGYTFPTNTEINTDSGAAGGLIGKMEDGILNIASIGGANISNLAVSTSSGSAGSIVGEMSETAQIQVNQNITITSPTIKGKYAGGFAGKVVNSTLFGNNTITVEAPTVSPGGDKTDSAVGGLIGDYTVKASNHTVKQLPTQIAIAGTPKVTTITKTNGAAIGVDDGNIGGYFGVLELQGDIQYEISGSDGAKREGKAEYTAGDGGTYGTVIGKVISDNKMSSLIINNVKSNSTTNGNSYYQGGLVGEIGKNVYLQVRNAEITVSNTTAKEDACGFGGVVGHLSSNSILSIADSVKVTISGTNTISGGGGLVGNASSGSILEISGTTDLSGVNYSASQYVGQLVGMQDCALIFAHGDGNDNGWKYIRSNSVSKINDIGNYGEVIRLKADTTTSDAQGGLDSELLKIDPVSHEIGYGARVNLTGNDITISSKEDLALLSIAWNSRGVFSADSNLKADNWTTLQNKNINFTADVNLKNTGIIGISRDIDDSAYTGNINGNPNTLTLSIGETYGYKGGNKAIDGAEGCGKIYSSGSKHTDIGLFSRMGGNVSNLTITGSIHAGVSNGNMWLGSIAARQENNETVISNVKVTTTIKFDTNKDSQISCIGGLFGSTAKVKLNANTLNENTCIQSNITLSNADNGKQTYVGSVAGYMSAGTLECNGVTIGGTIVTDASMYAYVGGLVGFMPPDGSDKDTSTQVNIKALTFDGFSITASNAQTACGGLLGGVCARSAVTFASDNTATTTSCLTVNSATINAPNASVGGLAYKASGLWEIRSKGIDIQNLKINCGKDLGLLVCHGEKRTIKFNKEEKNDKEDGALYLRTTADWDDSYKLAEGLELTCGSKAVFDEFVAYTAASKDKIANNDENGIVSIATKDRNGVKEENTTCKTYQNRTNLGKSHKINANSRYYYDLDEYTKNNTSEIDTSEELVLWSCAVYANSNIKKYFYTFNNQESSNPTISGMLDMDKYSYYPIHLNTGVQITDATITFYNEQIEQAETNNKSTQATTQSQHYMMHCGLFLDHSVNVTATSITLSDVTFAGSIGKVNSNASGVLFSGMVQGSESSGRQYTAKMNLSNIVLSGLKITDYTDSSYAPLLINQIGSYTKTEIKNLSTRGYTEGTAVASSLIGNAGSEDGHQINMGFSDIVLPDKPADATKREGIFTHATLLESYKYAANDTSVATYNFYKRGDWEGATYKHQVTYGKEISDSTEYKDLQKWYYDIATYNKKEGLVKTESNQTEPVFSEWLPYVYVSYDENNHSHEIKVNQRVFDITEGCGTYGDPYVIKDAGEMEIISEYMRTNLPRTDWKITITKEQNAYCTNHSKDITFRYNGVQWVEVSKEQGVEVQNGETRSNSFMQRYIANAYYDLQGGTNGEITLKDFKGFGTTDNPFRGVLVSTKDATLILTGANTGNGLIAYSYGSVVKDLTIKYKGEKKTFVYQKSSSVFYPTSCFGGAIGCILGGDNIIDGVNVTLADGWLTLSGANKHLLQVGGYVGSVCGGGVLFRNMQGKHVLTDEMISGGSVDSGVSVAETATSSLYVNHYVGRVLDGYAFADTAEEILDNTDKNYQIRNLNSSGTSNQKHITASGKTIEIKDAEGLLILSAIVNSGAASSGSSNAYRNITEGALQQGYAFGNGEYGKVRNAAYDSIGANTKPNDFDTAVKDDQTAPSDSNTPVLITKYADKDLFNMAVLNANATTSGATLTFPNNGTLDMSVYKSSYQGISARYVSNAVTSKNKDTGKTETKAAGIVPLIQGVSGNGTKIIFDMNVKEYADDDFHAASVGGVFNLFAPVKGTCNVTNLTFTGKTGTDPKTGVQLHYYTSAGVETARAVDTWGSRGYVGVGSFVGSSAGILTSSWYSVNVNFGSVKFENMTIQSPAVAGGLIGNIARINTPTTDIGILLQPYKGEQTVYPYNTFTNCSFRDLTVRGQENAGGFCGCIDGKVQNQNNLNVTTQNFIVGQDSTISAIQGNSSAGGLFGYARRGVAINTVSGTTYTAIWENVNVEAGQYSGGIIGQVAADSSNSSIVYKIRNVRVSGKTGTKSLIKGTSNGEAYTGGLIGNISSSGVAFDISDCEVQNAQINEEGKVSGEKFRTGGLVGSATGSGKLNVQNCSVEESGMYGSLAGGIAGALHIPTTITECTVSGLSNDKNIIKGQKSAAGIVGEIVCNEGKIGIHKSTVSNTSITAIDDWGAGGLVGDIDWNTVPKLYFYDSQVNGCIITGKRAGGFAGNIRGYLNGSNLLLKDTTIEASTANNGGLLIGLTGNRNLQPMTIAGISIQNTTAKENNRNISKLYGTLNETDNTNVKKQSYFSFADYNGTALNNTTQSLLDANPVLPYVVTSPTSQLSVYDAANANVSKALYGDSAAWTKDKDVDGKFTLNAQTIYRDAKNTQSSTAKGKYTYQEMGVEQFQFTKNISTYKKENQTKTVSNDFPVLVVSDNVSQTITDYLDIVTNGGYTRANNISGDSDIHVDASVKTYTDTDGKFVLATNANPALEVKKNASGRISEFVATTEFDNTKSRFTLLTVIFKEEDENGTEHKYNVQVPIVVRRMLEIGFTATLSSGTNYRATNYDLIEDNAHLLESTGNAFTAYLTYTYNSDDNGLYSEYGWNSYINAGGNVSQALDKSIDFQVSQGSSLPARTQLTLIDCQDNSKVYYYTTDSNTGNTIPLKDFKDSSENAFQAVSIGELMGVTATQDNNGSFIKVDAEGIPDGVTKEDGKTYTAPTVKIKTANGYEYYRKIETGESGTHYAVTVDESKLKDGVGPISTVHENYYLVITVADITSGTDLNGSVQTKITSNGIPLHLNYRTRKGKVEDTHSNTASTYQISHGYEQELTESEAVTGAIKKVTAADSSMTVDVIDKITIPSGQAFNNKDELYQKFSGSLIKTLKQENSPSTSAEVFPNGTTGTAAFYVYVMDGTTKKYYTYADGNWTEAESTETKALEYEWTAINGLMDLPLSTNGTIDSSVNLQQIRKIVLDKKQNEFYVEVKMNAKLPANGLEVIPESQLEGDLPTNYTKLTYTSQLATTRKSLSYSTARKLLQDTKIRYYRDEAAGVQLTYEADEIGQLGINLLDLQNSYLDATKENTIIDTTARYDMSTIKDLSSILASSSGIQFSIQLQNKNTTQDTESYAADALELEDYMKVSVKSEKAGTVQLTDNKKAYTWTVPKSSYWDDDKKIMKASSIFDGDIMTQAIQLKVNVKNVDQLYSNYKVVLSVKIIGQKGNVVENTTAADNIIYTMARVKPEFQDEQNK